MSSLEIRGSRTPAAWRDGLAIFLVSFGYLRLLPDCFNLFDEGVLADAAERVCRGAVLYRDVFTYWNPGGFWIAALMFRLFGISVETLRLSLTCVAAAAAVVVWRLARDDADRGLAAAAGLAVPFICYPVWWIASSHWYSTFSALAAALTLRPRLRGDGWFATLSTGLLCGITFVILQPVGVLLSAGAVAVLAWDGAWRASVATAARSVGLFLIGVLAPVTGMYGYFALHGALPQMLDDTLVWNFQHFRASHRVGYGVIPFGVTADLTLKVTRPVLMATPLICLLGLLVAMVGYARGRVRQEDRRLCAVAGVATALLLSNYYLPDVVHLAFAAPPTFAVLMILVSRMRARAGGRRLAVGAVALVVVASIGLGSLRRERRACSVAVATVRGPIAAPPDLADELREVFAYMGARLPPDAPLFVYPYGPGFNFLTAHPNASAYEYLFPNLPGANTEAQCAEVVDALDRGNVEYVLVSPLWGEAMLAHYDTAVERYIRAHYHLAARFPRTAILKRAPN